MVQDTPSLEPAQPATPGGRVERPDLSATLARLRSLAEQGDPEAQFRLGRLYRAHRIGPAAERMALEWLARAARRSHPQAQYDLGLMLLSGEGCDVDTAQGMHWLVRASAAGHELAPRLIRKIYTAGLFGFAPDPSRAAV